MFRDGDHKPLDNHPKVRSGEWTTPYRRYPDWHFNPERQDPELTNAMYQAIRLFDSGLGLNLEAISYRTDPMSATLEAVLFSPNALPSRWRFTAPVGIERSLDYKGMLQADVAQTILDQTGLQGDHFLSARLKACSVGNFHPVDYPKPTLSHAADMLSLRPWEFRLFQKPGVIVGTDPNRVIISLYMRDIAAWFEQGLNDDRGLFDVTLVDSNPILDGYGTYLDQETEAAYRSKLGSINLEIIEAIRGKLRGLYNPFAPQPST